MTPNDLIGVCVMCATALACTWLIGERWYAHRDRAYHRFTASCEVRVTQAIDDLRRARDAARLALDEGVQDRFAAIEAEQERVKRLTDEHKRWIESRHLSGR